MDHFQHLRVIFGKVIGGAVMKAGPLLPNSSRQNTQQIHHFSTSKTVIQGKIMYSIRVLNFGYKYHVPFWMFVDNFSRQTNNSHLHNLHSRKGPMIKPGHVTRFDNR